ncbi:MAG: DUF423 domain-containing protein [Chitinophagaceae bacterium]
MHKPFLIAGAIFGGLGVALGAFGAHGLQSITSDEKIIHGFQTAVEYQIYHALALLLTAIIFEKMPVKFIKWAGNCFIAGIILFSGSLYLLTFLKIQESSAVKIAGPVTPLGGVFFILGWLFLLIGVTKKN